jgi:hypothetical protein
MDADRGYLALGAAPPLVRRMCQGEGLRRPSGVLLPIDTARTLRVGGQVVAIGTAGIEP